MQRQTLAVRPSYIIFHDPSNDMSDYGHIFSRSRFGVFQDYYLKHPPYNKSSEAAINSIGTVALALQYGVMVWVIDVYQKHPRWSRMMTFMGLLTCSLSLLLAGFATAVSLLSSRLIQNHFLTRHPTDRPGRSSSLKGSCTGSEHRSFMAPF